MCSNYVPVTREDRLLTFFGIDAPGKELREGEVFPLGTIPIIRLAHESEVHAGERILDRAVGRFVPPSVATLARATKGFEVAGKANDPEWKKNTFNARSEDVATRRTFSAAWRKGQRCILPTEWFFEPRYFGTVERPGKSQRYRIQQVGGVPLGIAGLYNIIPEADGVVSFAACMLTVNADDHPVMSLFHRPGDEKRMPVILERDDYARWLSCTPEEAKAMCRQWHGQLEAFADLLPHQMPRQGGLF